MAHRLMDLPRAFSYRLYGHSRVGRESLPIANGVFVGKGLPTYDRAPVGRESFPIANGRFSRDPSNRKRRFSRDLPIANGPLIGPFQSQTASPGTPRRRFPTQSPSAKGYRPTTVAPCRSAILCRRIGSAKGFVGRAALALPEMPFAIGKGLPTYALPSWNESVHRDGKRSKYIQGSLAA